MLNDVPFVFTNLETAEMIKYASNAFRATRLDLQRVKDLLAEPVFFDLRNVYQPDEVARYGIDFTSG